MAVKFVFVFVMALFVTINVNRLRDPVKRLSLCRWLFGFNFDVVCLQEFHCVEGRGQVLVSVFLCCFVCWV